MGLQRSRRNSSSLPDGFRVDPRDRRPGTHCASEIGAPRPPRAKDVSRAARDAHVDEDLGCCAFGIELPFLRRE